MQANQPTTQTARADITASPRSPRPGLRAPSAIAVALLAVVIGGSLAVTATAAPSGQEMPTGDLDGWRQIFTEDFTTDVAPGGFPGGAYGAKWSRYPDGWWDVTHRSMASASVLSVSGGLLTWNFHSANGTPLNAVPQPKINGADPYKGITYGRFSVRLRSTKTSNGYGAVFLLWPDNDNWPSEGEIDFPGGELNQKLEYTIIRANPKLTVYGHRSDADFTQWHTATTEWRPGSVKFFVDGVLIGTETSETPRTPMHWLLQTGTIEAQPAPSAAVTANLQVDWAAAWAYSPGTTGSQPGAGPATTTRVSVRRRCDKGRARGVAGAIRVKFPKGSSRRAVRVDGKRRNARTAIDTTGYANGLHRIATAYTKRTARGRIRVRACAWIRVAN
ncbi:MAG: glycoside hydrolase family 16 protein [Solirubrobacterales bacterium]